MYTVSFNQKGTDCRQDHGLVIHFIGIYQYLIQMLVKLFGLTGKVGRIQRKFLRQEFMLRCKQQNLYLKFSQMFQR